MASNGIDRKAKKGTCRMCLRVRKTDGHLKIVGEVRHGFATGHIWECSDIDDCEKSIKAKLSGIGRMVDQERIKQAVKIGRFKEYMIST